MPRSICNVLLMAFYASLMLLPAQTRGQAAEWMNLISSLHYRQGELAVDQEGNLYYFATWNNHFACWPDPNAECPDHYSPNYALLLVKTNPQGIILNAKTWEPSSSYDYFAQGIRVDNQGSVCLLVENRFFANYNLSHELWKLDSNWEVINQRSIPVDNGVFAHFDLDQTGNIYLTYSIDVLVGQQYVDQLRITKYDAALTELWTCTLQGQNSDPRAMDIAFNNNKIGLIGRADGTLSFTNNPAQISGVLFSFLALIDATTGLPLVAERLNTYPATNNPTSLEPLPDGGFVLAGTFVNQGQLFDVNLTSSLAGEFDSYIAKVDETAHLNSYTVLEKVIANKAKISPYGQIVVAGQNPTDSLTLNFAGVDVELTPSPRKIFVCRLSTNLLYDWSAFWGSTGIATSGNENYQEAGYDLAFAAPKGIYLSGLSKFDHLVVDGDTTFDRGKSLLLMKLEDGSFSAGGRIWYDMNNNNAQDAGELPYSLKGIRQTSGNVVSFTTRSGRYRLPLATGTYSVAPSQVPDFFDIDPAVRNYTINQTDIPGPDTLNFRLIPQMIVEDVEMVATALGPPVPGQIARLQIDCMNRGTLPFSGTVNLLPDSHLYYNTMNPLGNLDGNRIFWYVNSLLPGDSKIFTVDLYVEPTTMPGSQLSSTAWFDELPDDPNMGNNSDTIYQIVLSSYDPNDKQVDKPAVIYLPSEAELLNQPFEYLIRFQNTGTYTAFKVVVRDTLSALLNPLSFNLISASHPVEIRVDHGNIMEFVFNNILLPDSTSNEPASHGFIRYNIRPLVAEIQNGDSISNTAHIYFDYNEPVATNTVVTKIEQVTGLEPVWPFIEVLRIYPNPASSIINLELVGEWPNEPLMLVVADATGKRLIQTPWQSNLSVASLPAGRYVLLLELAGRIQAVCSFVKK